MKEYTKKWQGVEKKGCQSKASGMEVVGKDHYNGITQGLLTPGHSDPHVVAFSKWDGSTYWECMRVSQAWGSLFGGPYGEDSRTLGSISGSSPSMETAKGDERVMLGGDPH